MADATTEPTVTIPLVLVQLATTGSHYKILKQLTLPKESEAALRTLCANAKARPGEPVRDTVRKDYEDLMSHIARIATVADDKYCEGYSASHPEAITFAYWPYR